MSRMDHSMPSCQTCSRAFPSDNHLRAHLQLHQTRIRKLVTELRKALTHTEECQSSSFLTEDRNTCEDGGTQSPALPTTNAIENDREDIMCPHAGCAGKARTSYTKKGNLQRHYYNHFNINEKCALCNRSFTCLGTLVLHYEYCKKKNGGSQDMKQSQATEPMKRLCQLASKELNDQLKKAVDPKDIPTDEESMHSEEACPLQKRRRIGENTSADLVPTAQYHQPYQVYGGNISGAASTTVAPFNSNLSSNSRLDPTHATGATPARAESISSGTIDPFPSHVPIRRAPFLSAYNVDDGFNQVPRAPFFSIYNMDESSNLLQIHSQKSIPTSSFPSHQSSVGLSSYGNDQVESGDVSQHKALSSSSQKTATLYARAPQLSSSAMNQYPNITQVTSQTSATMYENSQLMPYHAGPIQGLPNSGHSY